MSIIDYVKRWEDLLKKDQELKRRLKPFPEWHGGPVPYPGEGPYPTPLYGQEKFDVSCWAKAKGYSRSILDGRELIEICVPGAFIYTIKLEKGLFSIVEGKAKEPCLGITMPLSLFKELILSRHRIVWALTDERVKLRWIDGVAHSDWITILELLAIGQEAVDKDPKMWDIVEAL